MSEWKKVKIGDFLKRKRISVDLEPEKEYKLLTIKLYHKGVFLRCNKKGSEIHSNMYQVSKGDFILSGIDARNGAFGIVPESLDGAIVTNDFWYFDIDESIIKKDFFLWLTSTPVFLDACQKSSMGETQRIRLQKDAFYNYTINCPSIDYQEEFLSKINPLIEKLRIIQSETEKQTEYAKLLRQNILQDAIEGKLTAAWRKQNPVQKGNPDYDAEALFAQIQEEKTEKKQKKLAPITDEEKPFEIPKGWKWVHFGDVIEIATNIVESSSYKDMIQVSPDDIEKNTGKLIYPLKTVREKEIISVNHIFHKDMLVYSKIRPRLRKIVYVDFDGLCSADMYPLKTKLNCFYIKNLILSDYFDLEVYKFDNRVKMPKINQPQLNSIKIPIPPLYEQKEIVKQVERLLQTASGLENQIAERETYTKQLMQSILKDAFGEG